MMTEAENPSQTIAKHTTTEPRSVVPSVDFMTLLREEVKRHEERMASFEEMVRCNREEAERLAVLRNKQRNR